MKKIKSLAVCLFPFICFDIFFGPVFFPVIFATITLAYFYSAGIRTRERGRIVSFTLVAAVLAYWIVITITLVIFAWIIISYYFIFAIVTIVVIALTSLLCKWRTEIAAGLLLNVFTVVLFVMFLPPGIGSATIRNLDNEKYVQPIFTFADYSKHGPGRIKTGYQGVRSILTDDSERAVYITADVGPRETNLPSLFRIDLGGASIRKYKGDRMFGLAFTPDGDKLLSTGYYRHKLIILDPVMLKRIGTRNTPVYPQSIIVDKRGARITITHESHGTVSVFKLPELKFLKESRVDAAPNVIDTDMRSRTFFAANWLYPYLLSEVEIYSLQTPRRKYFLHFASGGVSRDNSGRRVYVIDSILGNIYVVDRASFKTIRSIKIKPLGRSIRVDDKRRLMYVGSVVEPFIRVYNFNGSQIAKIFTGANCRDIFITPVTKRVFAGTVLGLMELKIDDLLDKSKNRK
jgi:DNA-binding beta-propeller fold protein YncE